MSASGKFARLPGFRDFPPEDLALRSHIFDAWRRVSRRYGFVEYDGPPLEDLELYTDKSGDEIVGQLYTFTDKGERKVALRPEMTPSLARILASRSRALPKPIRWFGIPQLFRYERQQRGRLREHFQWNVDLVGEGGVEADAEVLAVALEGLIELGLDASQVRARVSDRILFSAILRASNVPEAQLDSVFVLVDRMEREPKEQLVEKLQNDDAIDLSKEQIDSILGVLDVSGVDEIERAFPRDEPVLDRTAELRRYLSVLEDLGFAEFVEVDLKIVRGLAYYTGIVFEIFDRVGELRAICGGGRYDGLLERVGGDSLPAAGFGMGDVVLGELLKDRDLVPDYRPEVDYFIVSIDETQRPLARRIASAQRLSGLSVVYPVGPQSVRRQFSSAAAAGAGSVIVLGPEEVDRGVATVRDMASGGEKEVPLERLTRREAEGKAASVSGEGEEE